MKIFGARIFQRLTKALPCLKRELSLGGVADSVSSLSYHLLRFSSIMMATLVSAGSAYPTIHEGKLYLMVRSMCRIDADPYQPESGYSGAANKYHRAFSQREEKRITPKVLSELDYEIPMISLSITGRLELRDHHRVRGAQSAQKSIVVCPVLNMVSKG
ncbi:MAG: hypothetical protein HQ564_09695 [Candidatus Saganbacteria bacterium]|nr:hypothetical protein [Candidatus Saganbacteria bacterium]